MSYGRRKSTEALYNLVCNHNNATWIREEALQELIDREEVSTLECIVENHNLATWIREQALSGLRKMK